MAKERIGILGGTFDPIHQGHIRMALSVLDSCRLDRLLVLPSGHPAYKDSVTPPEDRWKMVVMACTQDARLVPSRLSTHRPCRMASLLPFSSASHTTSRFRIS